MSKKASSFKDQADKHFEKGHFDQAIVDYVSALEKFGDTKSKDVALVHR